MDRTVQVGQQSLLGYLPAIVIKNILDSTYDTQIEPPAYKSMTTVSLFADISGFTKLSEAFSKKGRTGSEFLAFCLNRYMEQLINIIGKNGGDIFKFAGDALLVIWPEDKNSNLEESCRRAVQCALAIQSKLNKLEMSKGKVLSVKVGLGVGECKILFVGGVFGRCEYLIVGEAMRQACTSECHCKEGGETVVSEKVYNIIQQYYEFELAEPDLIHGPGDGLSYYKFVRSISERVTTRADAFLMRTHFNSDKIREKMMLLKTFVPAAINKYLEIEKESWSKELRLLTIMFLNLTIDLKNTQTEEGLQRIQHIIYTVQRCVYRTRGSLNKFLMDDKGSVMLIVWGLPPISAHDDHTRSVLSALDIIEELKKYGCGAKMGITTGSCFTGVCGNIGGRREYSLLGEIVNLSARYMQKAMTLHSNSHNHSTNDNEKSLYQVLVCEQTKNLIQDKISSKWVDKGMLKGFENEFHFYEPILESNITTCPGKSSMNVLFPEIKTHRDNVFLVENDVSGDKSLVKTTESLIKNALFMVGRKHHLVRASALMEDMMTNNSMQVLMVNGIIGSGKSLFIRNLMCEFTDNHKDIKSRLQPVKYPFIFISNQYPTTLCDPLNGFSKILKEIFHIVKSQLALKKKMIQIGSDSGKFFVNCDEIGEILINTRSLNCLRYIEEILGEKLDSHYDPIRDKPEYNVIEIEKRDTFFQLRKFDKNSNRVCQFFIELIKRYRQNFIPSDPLIFIIEDSQLMDDISIEFIKDMTMENIDKMMIITAYQNPLNPNLKNEQDHFNKISELFDPMKNIITLEGLQNHQEISEILLHYCRTTRNAIVDRVSETLINSILCKSFNGNPLFLIEIVDSLLSQKYLHHPMGELTYKSEFEEIIESNDWSRVRIPIIIEKVIGNIIDNLKPVEVILLKHASVIGAIFDIDKLYHVNPFDSITFDDLFSIIMHLESECLLEILYDLKPKHLVAKFCMPFFRDICYQRMLVEQKNDIHLNVARKMQYSKFTYMPRSKEVMLLKNHLRTTEKTILMHMEDNPDESLSIGGSNVFSGELNTHNQKIFVVKDICEKLKIIDRKINSEDVEISKRSMPIIKSSILCKKSDHGPTWEDRFVVATNTKFFYWYQKEDYNQNNLSLGSFDLKNIYMVKVLKDREIGDRPNLIQLQVSSWYKKDELRGARGYIFSCPNKEELYTWVIAFNFLRVKSIYDEFTFNFGLINLPLNHELKGKNPKKVKRKFHNHNRGIDNKHSGSLVFGIRKSVMSNKSSSVKKKTERISSTYQLGFEAIGKEKSESDNINKMKEILSKVIGYGVAYFIGSIQEEMLNEDVPPLDDDRTIRLPAHLNKFKELPSGKNVIGSPKSMGSIHENKHSNDEGGVNSDLGEGEDFKGRVTSTNPEVFRDKEMKKSLKSSSKIGEKITGSTKFKEDITNDNRRSKISSDNAVYEKKQITNSEHNDIFEKADSSKDSVEDSRKDSDTYPPMRKSNLK